MSRQPRKSSDTGIYHILLRCVKDDKFFREENDYIKFIDLLKKNKYECGYMLYAYMLSEKEMRFLLRVGNTPLENIFKRICVKYAFWYNCKYERNGSLFYDRFRSEAVENDTQFEDVYRYIIKRPESINLCDKYENYKFSSVNINTITDIYKDYIPKHPIDDSTDEHLPVKNKKRVLTDERAEQIILNVTNKSNLEQVKNLPAKERFKNVRELILNGVGYRQLARLANMNYATAKKYETETVTVKKKVHKNRKKTEKSVIDFFSV